jgi:hypothetical protein
MNGKKTLHPVGVNEQFTEYFTFPDYDVEEERLKLELWLYFTRQELNPVEYMWEKGLW